MWLATGYIQPELLSKTAVSTAKCGIKTYGAKWHFSINPPMGIHAKVI